jgi:ABC-type nitrate/sulfonate/bicarbonate transport system substrate-binding protein
VSKAKVLLASLVWLFIILIGVMLYRWWYVPSVAEQEQQKQAEIVEQTSGSSNYKYTVKLGLDAFSGYAVLRSAEMKQQLRSQGIKLELVDDGANYESRISALASGDLDMAAFPIDALLKASAKLGQSPATIIAIIDESRGADALVAYKAKYPNVDALNTPDTRFVLVGDSPSETLARFVIKSFKLPQVTPQSIDAVSGEKQLLERYRNAKPGGNEVFVTWQPVVSQLLDNGQMGIVWDSSQQTGVIVDTLVVSRDFLVKNDAVVTEVIESYLRALFAFAERDKLLELVRRDAGQNGSDLTDKQVEDVVNGIVWKNTQENFAHFGLRRASVVFIEDMIDRIKRVLMDTGGLTQDPTQGQSTNIFTERPLAKLRDAGFHPGVSEESIREDAQLQPLTDSQWQSLVPVGTVDVPPLIFPRGTARLTESSRFKLDSLIETLASFPRYYLIIRGDASSVGNLTANQRLAKQRADAALQYLLDEGLPAARMKAVEGEITGEISVTFVLGQLPY